MCSILVAISLVTWDILSLSSLSYFAGPLAREMLGGSFCCRDKNQTDVKAAACGGADAEVVFGE